jgi:tetratricopeptide (TPR) repeat protein
MEKSISAFQQALAIDPDYAPAWTGLAWAYEYQRRYNFLPYEQAIKLAREAAEKALAIDDSLALAWSTLSFLMNKYDWDWEGAEAAMNKALQLEPNNTDVLLGAASVASTLGQLDRSIELLERAVALDPLRLEALGSLGRRYTIRGRHDEALKIYRRILVLFPEDSWTPEAIAETYLRQGNPEHALAEMKKLSYSHNLNSLKAEALFVLGKEEESRALTSEFLNTPAQFGSFAKAKIHAWRGENEAAFKSLEMAFEQRNRGLANILLFDAFHHLEADPRYPIFLEKLGLLEAWKVMPRD